MTPKQADTAALPQPPVRARSFMAAAASSRALLETLLAEPVPRGRRRTTTATTRARVAFAVVYLTLGYSKTADRFAMRQLEALTGYPARTIGRFLGQLAGRGWLDYHPANNHHARPFNEVKLRVAGTTALTASPGRSRDTESVDLVTAAARQLIETVLHERQPLATLRIAAVLLADLVTWLHTQGSVDTAVIASRTHLDRKTVGRKLQALAELGVLDYHPGRGRGQRGTVRLRPPSGTVDTQPASQPSHHLKTGARRPRAIPPLTPEQRRRANQFLERVFVVLDRQHPGQSDQVATALQERLRNKDRLGQLIASVLDAGGEHQLLAALTAPRGRGGVAYAHANDPAAALFRRVQNCHSELGLLPLSANQTSNQVQSTDRNTLTELLRHCFEEVNDLQTPTAP